MKKIVLVVFAIAIVFLNGCTSSKKKNQEIDKIKVAQFGKVFIYMPVYLADIKGFFKEEGIEIELISTGGDDKTYAALISGSAVFGVADPTFVAIAAERGQKGKVIASIVNGVPFWGVAVSDRVPGITNPKMLKGFSVATFPSPSTAYVLQKKMFINAGLKPDIKQGAFGSLLPMLLTGQVDIALELEPNVSTAIKKNHARVLYSLAKIYGNFALTGVTVLDKTIKENHDLVQRFVNALQKAETYAHTYPDSAAFYAQKVFPDMDKEIIKNAMARIIKSNTLPKSVVISNDAWKKALNLRYEIGDLKSVNEALNVLDNRFAIKATQSK